MAAHDSPGRGPNGVSAIARLSFTLIVASALVGSGVDARAQASAARAVPTYESVGLYWPAPGAVVATGCNVRFRKTGTTAWTPGLAMWFDPATNECRGSIVALDAGTAYQAELSLPGQSPARVLDFTTWSNGKPVAQRIVVPGGSGTLNVTQGGSASGYVVYEGAPGAVLDAANGVPYNVTVNASYVIVRGFTLRGAQQDAIRISPNATDVIVEDNDISGWGRQRAGIYGVEQDSGVHAVCPSASSAFTRVTVQRNRIHDPRYTANSWSTGHPEGPQAVTFNQCGGNNVIRHNEMYSASGRYFNDIIGGSDNASTTGFPNADSDIYGNRLQHAWDDAIEAEGGNRNVRIWGNYIDRTGTGIATTLNTVGPIYIFRNVYNRSRILQDSPPDADDRQVMFKAGSNAAFADGRRYIFHNTTLQAMEAGSIYGLGASGGISGTGSTQLTNNTVSRNNIFHNWRTWTAYYDIGTGNDFANDMYNGSAGAPDRNGIHAYPTYAPGHGWMSEDGGMYQLLVGTPGYDQAERIPNFNDAFNGLAPDVGAHEGGSARMLFGIAASSGPAAPPATVTPRAPVPDFDRDGRGDLLLSHVDGRAAIYLMNGTAIAASGEIIGAATGWSVARFGDFNGDGKTDLAWQHPDGRAAIYVMNGTAPASTAQILNAGPWTITHSPDLNGDGKSDLLFRNVDGSIAAWLMNGTAMAAGATLMGPATGWRVANTADFDGDGKDDLLWTHPDGRAAIWLMNGTAVKSTGQILNAGAGWNALHAVDLDGDGKADIVWQNADGRIAAWLMNGTAMASGAELMGAASGWTVARTGDFDGDGRADLLFQHTDGRAAVWLMNGLAPTAQAQILNAGGGWSAARVEDLDGDGKSDIVWQNLDGRVAVWLMNGTAMTGGSGILGPATGWSISPAP
jgi:VCBS repeat protein